MTVRVTKNNIPKDVFKQVRKEFTRNGTNARNIKKAIIDDMGAGVSPVASHKWKKYSQSYKDVIRGKKTFRRTKEGKTLAFNSPDKAFLKHKKPISPVNLKLSGGLWQSLKVSTTGKVITVAFENFLALVHNNLGASKKKFIRRLLPTEQGEKFNESITQVVENGVKKAIDIVVKRINRQ